jgi:hypothetical protein
MPDASPGTLISHHERSCHQLDPNAHLRCVALEPPRCHRVFRPIVVLRAPAPLSDRSHRLRTVSAYTLGRWGHLDMRKLWYAHYPPSRTNRRELLTESLRARRGTLRAYDQEALLGVAAILTPRNNSGSFLRWLRWPWRFCTSNMFLCADTLFSSFSG